MIKAAYQKYQNLIERFLFPMLLLLYPLLKAGRGLDVLDGTYSLANFAYFGSMDGTWMVATFLANAVGSLLMRLPFGGTLRGMYFYTLLLQSALALLTYDRFCRKVKPKVPAPLVFAGELTALGLCWCPSTVLYNYLTYLLLAAGIWLLYSGILRGSSGCYAAAGVCLGLNAAVRMPNVMQTALILAVWYGGFLYRRQIGRVCRDTLWCLLGYAAGFGVPLAAICVKYGVTAYPDMVRTMFAMTDRAADYKPASMLTGMLRDYGVSFVWLLLAALCIAGGWLLETVRRRLAAGSRAGKLACAGIYTAVFLVLLRVYWGRGMFTFRYYEYRSIYYPAALLILTAALAAVLCICRRGAAREQKVLAALTLLQTFVTPLGSNNALYPIINDLFLVIPFLLGAGYEWLAQSGRNRDSKYIAAVPLLALSLFVLVQSVGFHLSFSFHDGMDGAARNTTASAPDKVRGIRTTADNAESLADLAAYAEADGLTGRSVILYGNIPGMGYLLDMPPALSTFWPELDSYMMAEFERDMARLREKPAVIVQSAVAAYLDGGVQDAPISDIDRERLEKDEKLLQLSDYMRQNGYRETFRSDSYAVYVTE